MSRETPGMHVRIEPIDTKRYRLVNVVDGYATYLTTRIHWKRRAIGLAVTDISDQLQQMLELSVDRDFDRETYLMTAPQGFIWIESNLMGEFGAGNIDKPLYIRLLQSADDGQANKDLNVIQVD